MIKLLNPNHIVIEKGRYRQDLGDLNALADSIKMTNGNVVPIQVYDNQDGTYTLISGERRTRACMLARLPVKAEILTENDIPQKALEAIENIERKQFTWQEEIEAKDMLHKMYEARAKVCGIEWSKRKTATCLKIPISGLSTELNLADAVKEMPELFEGCKTKDAALKVLKQFKIEEAVNELASRKSGTEYGQRAKNMVFNGDCLELVDQLTTESVSAVIVDPPFGIDYDSKDSEAAKRAYKDDTKFIVDTLLTMITKLDRVLKKDSAFFMFCAIENFSIFREALQKIGFLCAANPCLWYKSNTTTGRSSHPHIYMGNCYELAVYGFRGNATLAKVGCGNVISHPTFKTSQLHITTKPVGLLEEVIARMCLPGSTILDFMCGSGSTLVAAIKQGCKPIGFELDEHYYSVALNNVADALKAKDAGLLHTIGEL